MSKKYYWLKLKDDFFKQKEIKKLRRIAGGDTYTIIYLKLQLLSLKNEGYLYFEGVEDNFAEELSLELDESIENIQMTLAYLQKHNLIEEKTQDEFILIETLECIGKETDTARRVRKHRDKKLLQCNTEMLQCNSVVTKCNTEKEKEKEKEKYICQKIIEFFNENTNFSKVVKNTDARFKLINARLKEHGEEKIKEVILKANKSEFLTGVKTDWKANFDWIMNVNNFVKVMEGNYDNKGQKEEQKIHNPYRRV